MAESESSPRMRKVVGTAHPGGPVNSTFGRVVFGVAAILMDLFAFYAWRLSIRLLMTGSEAKKPSDAGSK
jgi:hypothetical protein